MACGSGVLRVPAVIIDELYLTPREWSERLDWGYRQADEDRARAEEWDAKHPEEAGE